MSEAPFYHCAYMVQLALRKFPTLSLVGWVEVHFHTMSNNLQGEIYIYFFLFSLAASGVQKTLSISEPRSWS